MDMPERPLEPGTQLRVTDDDLSESPWYPVGSKVVVICDCREGGVLVLGRLADGTDDKELCGWEEFDNVPEEVV